MSYTKSKAVEHCMLVTLRGNRFIRANKKSKLRGVYTGGGSRKTLLFNGEKVETHFPEGIITWGVAEVKVRND